MCCAGCENSSLHTQIMGLLLAETGEGKHFNESVQGASPAMKKPIGTLGVLRNGTEKRGANITMALHKPVVRPQLEHRAQFRWPPQQESCGEGEDSEGAS